PPPGPRGTPAPAPRSWRSAWCRPERTLGAAGHRHDQAARAGRARLPRARSASGSWAGTRRKPAPPPARATAGSPVVIEYGAFVVTIAAVVEKDRGLIVTVRSGTERPDSDLERALGLLGPLEARIMSAVWSGGLSEPFV